MRRNALPFTLCGYAILLVLVLLSAVGKAQERHEVATASAQKPPILLAATLDTPAEEMLHDIGLPAVVVPPKPRTLTMEVTAYCPCKKCCGKKAQGVTASGLKVTHNRGQFVAADTAILPFHQKLLIPGYADGVPVPVIDRGGAIKGNRLDVFFATHEQALQWGRRTVDVVVLD